MGRIGLWAIALWAIAAGAPAMAYVPRPLQVLGMLADKMGSANSLRVYETVRIHGDTASGDTPEMTETLSCIFPDRFRSDAWFRNTNRIYVSDRGRSLYIIDSTVVARRAGRLDAFKDLLLYRSSVDLNRTLLNQGVDTGLCSLGRFEGRIAYVIGAQYPDESVSQVWIDKERLLPLRYLCVYPAAEPAGRPERIEFLFHDWRKYGDLWYPQQVQTYSDNQLIRTASADRVTINPAFSPDLLNVSYLLTVYQQAAQPMQTDGSRIVRQPSPGGKSP